MKNVTMGAFDCAEVCELVGIFNQHKLSETYDIGDFGVYRDDGLAIFKNVSGPDSERIECNKTIVDFLDITMNLNNGTKQPYSKPDNKLQYIHTKSNHHPNVIE